MTVKQTKHLLQFLIAMLFVWLWWQNFVPTGILKISGDLANKDARITDMRPGEFFTPWQTDGNTTFHTIKKSPIYFHVHTPRQFQQADIEIMYRTESLQAFSFGGQTGPELYEFNYQPIKVIADGQWHTATTTIDLGHLRFNENHKRYQFSFNNIEEIDIAGSNFTFTKPPITPHRLWKTLLQID